MRQSLVRRTASRPHRRCRSGFTLVEMLVVLILILILAALAVLFVPKVNERRNAARGADLLQQALLTAKNRAVRDRAPRGIRLQPLPIVFSTGRVVPNSTGIANLTMPISGIEQGMKWTILPGTRLLVYDTPPPAPGGTPDEVELFRNLDVVTVESVLPAGVVASGFKNIHPNPSLPGYQTRIKVLALARDLAYIGQPDDYQVTPGLPSPPFSDREIRRLRSLNVAEIQGLQSAGVLPPWPLVALQNRVLVLEAPPSPTLINPPPGDFTGGNRFAGFGHSALPRNPVLWPVQAGDYLELKGAGPVRRIYLILPSGNSTNPAAGYDGDLLVLNIEDPPLMQPVTTYTRDYRIIRTPRPLPGEAPVQLPVNVAIDLASNFAYGNPLPIDGVTGQIDILFAPTGGMVSRALSTDRINLWVRDASLDVVDVSSGVPRAVDQEQSIITTYARTGFIAAYPVNSQVNPAYAPPPYMPPFPPPPPGTGYPFQVFVDPYRFTRSSGNASGL